MQVPHRKYDKYPRTKPDPHLTAAKYQELTKRLDKLKNIQRPREAEEVKRLALMGDFSENAGYQLAKSRLRGINQRILDISDLLARAEIITPSEDKAIVQLGHTVTIESRGKIKKYQILGSAETSPAAGVISHNAPLGAALLGRKLGESVTIRLGDKEITYKITRIE